MFVEVTWSAVGVAVSPGVGIEGVGDKVGGRGVAVGVRVAGGMVGLLVDVAVTKDDGDGLGEGVSVAATVGGRMAGWSVWAGRVGDRLAMVMVTVGSSPTEADCSDGSTL